MISRIVIWEGEFVAFTVTIGMALSLIYDIIRIIRRIIPHGTWAIAVEDILFWTFVGVFIFVISFMEIDGTIRWYTLCSVAMGAFMYYYTVSRYVVKYVTKTLIFPVEKTKWILKKIYDCIRIKK